MGAAPGAARFLGFDDMAGAEKRPVRHRVVGGRQSKLKRPRIVAVGGSDSSSAAGSGLSRGDLRSSTEGGRYGSGFSYQRSGLAIPAGMPSQQRSLVVSVTEETAESVHRGNYGCYAGGSGRLQSWRREIRWG